jgi:hypothetical protein
MLYLPKSVVKLEVSEREPNVEHRTSNPPEADKRRMSNIDIAA